ncbi:MAG: DUF488 family protein [Microbacterium sp.]|nr:MAG: DUF488 family protein [Microbacterium sp.]
MHLRCKRIYDPPAAVDGFRVLVDRLWPRGITKERAALDLWAKEVAPSNELRTAFHRGELGWDSFAEAYEAELTVNPAVAALRETVARHEAVTLLYSVNDVERNHALLLSRFLAAVD